MREVYYQLVELFKVGHEQNIVRFSYIKDSLLDENQSFKLWRSSCMVQKVKYIGQHVIIL